ncbi:hypothetical protein [Nonomuraea sp. NPDC049684]|uniref:hypothetical protein n=1 Tax=unclassified Nonomuraea TaxID=2593643 RepID=UPI0037AA34F5
MSGLVTGDAAPRRSGRLDRLLDAVRHGRALLRPPREWPLRTCGEVIWRTAVTAAPARRIQPAAFASRRSGTPWLTQPEGSSKVSSSRRVAATSRLIMTPTSDASTTRAGGRTPRAA